MHKAMLVNLHQQREYTVLQNIFQNYIKGVALVNYQQLFMKILIPVLSLICMLAITGCQKSVQEIKDDGRSSAQIAGDSTSSDSNILVDASKDGGVWWFPQAPPSFSSRKITREKL